MDNEKMNFDGALEKNEDIITREIKEEAEKIAILAETNEKMPHLPHNENSFLK